jgi:hypothetical protein
MHSLLNGFGISDEWRLDPKTVTLIWLVEEESDFDTTNCWRPTSAIGLQLMIRVFMVSQTITRIWESDE